MFHNNSSSQANKGVHPTHQPSETNSIQPNALNWFFVYWWLGILILPNLTHHIYIYIYMRWIQVTLDVT